jgi:diketogulonate reductase-like aldo/keto reductase
MKENLEVYGFELTAEEMSRIDNLRSSNSTLLPFMPEWINS